MGIVNAIDNFFSDIHGAFIVGRTNDALKKLQKELDKLPEGAVISRPKPTMPVPEDAEPINKGPIKTSSEKVPEPEEVVVEELQPEEVKQPETVIVEEQPVQEVKQPEKKTEPVQEETKKPEAKKPESKKKPENQKILTQEKKPDPVQEETKKPEKEAKQSESEQVQEQPEPKPGVEPEKKPEPAKTQHTESLNMQMGDIDAILNNKRRSRKVSPPGGGVGSAIKK